MARASSRNGHRRPRVDVAAIRREQIVEAAVAIIAEQGLQNLSLSEIETRAGMSRGQLTYYFPAKEDILLAVFDRLLHLTYERMLESPRPAGPGEQGFDIWTWIQHLLEAIVVRPPASPEFHCLQYTFLAQIAHRDDFRRRLAQLFGEWRNYMADDLAALPGRRPRTDAHLLASFVQAVLHGLSMQLAADPDAFDREAMYRLCVAVLRPWIHPPPAEGKAARRPRTSRNGSKR